MNDLFSFLFSFIKTMIFILLGNSFLLISLITISYANLIAKGIIANFDEISL